MSRRKLDSKTFAQQKRRRRQFLTFMRMCRYGINNFSRNAWLTIAATAVMTITLIIIFISVAAHSILTATVSDLRQKVDMSIYFQVTTPDSAGAQLVTQVEKLSSVQSATYENTAQVRNDFVKENSGSASTIAAVTQATNQFPAILHVVVRNIDDTSQLTTFVEQNALAKQYISTSFAPSFFAGNQNTAIKNIGSAVDFVQTVGVGAGILFIAISTLIIFNTIRMAIFNRKEEIQMMKLIGADKSFIRGPFIVEAIVYGFIAAIIATVAGVAILLSTQGALSNYFSVQSTVNFVTFYGVFVLLGMIIIGALIGIFSSLLATGRYLKL
jgi:cell division transport system permease protein